MSSTLGRLLDIRERRVEQAQIKASVCRTNCQKAEKNLQSSQNILDSYVWERPILEESIYSNYKKSDCRSTDLEGYRHHMQKCAAEQARLEKEKMDAIAADKIAKKELEAILVELGKLKLNVEKISLLENDYLKEKELVARRKAENELDDISSLGYGKSTS